MKDVELKETEHLKAPAIEIGKKLEPIELRERLDGLTWNRMKIISDCHRHWEACRLGVREMVDEANTATPQTIKKLRHNVIDRLHNPIDKNEAPKISTEQKDAAEEIMNVWTALGRGMWTGRQEPGNRVDGGGKWADPIDRMSELEGIKFSNHYAPWMREAEKVVIKCRKPPGQPLTAAILTWDMVVNNNGPDQLGRYYGMPRHDGRRLHCGCVLCWVRKALFRYAEIAGCIHPARALGVSVWD